MPSSPADVLRERGLRVTGQRLAVLRAVSESPHVTADALARSVRAQLGSVSLQAVYDALGTLVDVGLVRRIQPAGSPALFEARVADNHHHLICRSCGAVTDVDCVLGSAPCLSVEDDHGYDIDEAEITFWGRCPDCAGLGFSVTPTSQRLGRPGAALPHGPQPFQNSPSTSHTRVTGETDGREQPPAPSSIRDEQRAAPR